MKPFLALVLLVTTVDASNVRMETVPESGVQPQVAVDDAGTVHLVYLKGDPQGCDVRYARRTQASPHWSTPIAANSEPRSAIAMGTIRGAQLALGKRGTLHIVWNGAGGALFYSRLEPGGMKFEPQRNLLGGTVALDGGASVAANTQGEVFVFWHGKREGDGTDETARRVFVVKSRDNGAQFDVPTVANPQSPGVCACCSLKAFAAPNGDLLVLYRAARSISQRDMTLLVSKDRGATFQSDLVHQWNTATCPMSSAAIHPFARGVRMAWETQGRVFSKVLGDPPSEPVDISDGNGKHPSIATNALGETLVAWAIGTGWKRGGELAWVILDSAGKPSKQRNEKETVPVWSFPAAYAEANGDFVILR